MKILLKNAKILTLKSQKIIEGDLLVVDEKIAQIARKITIKADRVINCEGNLLMPGFKNAHTHSAMTCLRSKADDLPLLDWLEHYVFPSEKLIRKNDIYHLAKISYLEYLTSGITACFDMYFADDEIVRAAKDIGMRLVFLKLPCNTPSDIKISKQLIKNNRSNNLVTYKLGLHAEYTHTTQEINSVAKIARELKIPLYAHCSETKKEVDGCIKRRHMTPLKYLAKTGYFDYGGGIFHGVHLTKDDIKILKAKKAFVCTCPASNLKLVSGIAPIKDLLKAGIKVAIGTDGPASNNALDMFREMYLASVLSKYRENNPGSIDSFTILKMATVNGAEMMGLNDAKYLAVNQKADIIMIDLSRPDMQPINNIIANLVYSGNKLDVKMTMINGKVLYYNNKFYLKESIFSIYERAQAISNRLNNLKTR